eukprot:scaffold181706_cov43-Prasinocladus_malaysianus.AAC.1
MGLVYVMVRGLGGDVKVRVDGPAMYHLWRGRNSGEGQALRPQGAERGFSLEPIEARACACLGRVWIAAR